MSDWPFADPPNVAVFTTRGVIEDGRWVAHIAHDADDGAWQFHGNDPAPPSAEDARLVSLRSMIARDPGLADLADLPLGWIAERAAPDAPWHRRPAA
jgi:hypothetical protein